MQLVEIILGIALLVLAVVISVLVMMQKSKEGNLSGAIAGGSDNFLNGSKKGSNKDMFNVVILVLNILFVNDSLQLCIIILLFLKTIFLSFQEIVNSSSPDFSAVKAVALSSRIIPNPPSLSPF